MGTVAIYRQLIERTRHRPLFTPVTLYFAIGVRLLYDCHRPRLMAELVVLYRVLPQLLNVVVLGVAVRLAGAVYRRLLLTALFVFAKFLQLEFRL